MRSCRQWVATGSSKGRKRLFCHEVPLAAGMEQAKSGEKGWEEVGDHVQMGVMGRGSSESMEGQGTGGDLAPFLIVTGSRRSK